MSTFVLAGVQQCLCYLKTPFAYIDHTVSKGRVTAYDGCKWSWRILRPYCNTCLQSLRKITTIRVLLIRNRDLQNTNQEC